MNLIMKLGIECRNMIWVAGFLGMMGCVTPKAEQGPGTRETPTESSSVKTPSGAMVKEGQKIPHYEDCDPNDYVGEVEDNEEQAAQVEAGIEVDIPQKGTTPDKKPRPYTRYKCKR